VFSQPFQCLGRGPIVQQLGGSLIKNLTCVHHVTPDLVVSLLPNATQNTHEACSRCSTVPAELQKLYLSHSYYVVAAVEQ